MQKYYTQDEFQALFKKRMPAPQPKGNPGTPSPAVLNNLLAYASALNVVKTASLGFIFLVMN